MTRNVALPELREDTATFLQEVNAERAGKMMLMDGQSQLWPAERRIRSGSIDLDIALGIGGWPTRRVVEIFGEESSGKTTTAMHAVREAQGQGFWTAYFDTENSLDSVYCGNIGIDLKSMMLCQPNHLEEAIDLMHFLMTRAAESGRPGGLIVVDSVPATMAKDIMENSAEKETRALGPRRWSTNLPKLVKAAEKANVCLMLINQTRSTMATMPYQKQSDTPGGKAIKFTASVRAQVYKKIEKTEGDQGGLDWQTMEITLIKNKCAAPFKKGRYTVVPGQPISWESDVIANAVRHGFILEDSFVETKVKKGESVDPENVISRKSWYHMSLSENAVKLIREDEPDFEPQYPFIQVHRLGPFIERVEGWTALLARFEELILDSLNASDIHLDTTEMDAGLDVIEDDEGLLPEELGA